VIVVWESDPPGTPPPAGEFGECRSAGRVVTGIDNEEGSSATVWTCAGPVGGWAAVWPRLAHLDA
jgi:hypothetical protein